MLFLLTAYLLSAFVNAQQYFQDVSGNLPAAAIGENTMDVEVADLNGDGYSDLVLAKEWRRNRLLFNDGNGNFTDVSEGNFSNAQHDSEDIAIADFDGNGWLDIVFAAEDDASHEMYLNTGEGNFTEVSDRLPSFISNAVKTWDANGDGFPDLIFGNAGQNKLLINDGTGNFIDETAVRLPIIDNTTQDILLVDIDGDMDIVCGNEDGNNIWMNNGAGIFTDETGTRFPQGTNMETRKVSTADVNGDGFPDLFFSNMASFGGPDLKDRLYLNDGNGIFTDVTDTHLPFELKHSFDAVFTDLNNDGHPDLIVGYLSNLLPAVLINDGNGDFSDQSSSFLPNTATGNNIAVYVVDLNGDGNKDLYLGRFQQNDALFFASPLLSTSENNINEKINIYPNPASDSINLNIRDSFDKTSFTVSLFSLEGKKILQNQYKKESSINFSIKDLPQGIYSVHIKNHEEEFTKKLIVKR